MLFVQVALPIPKRSLFTYGVPDGMTVAPGFLVLVPVAHSYRTGVVWEITAEPAWKEGKILEIADTLGETPLLGADLLYLLDWMSRYYLRSIGSVATVVLPGRLEFKRKRRAIWQEGQEIGSLPDPLMPLATRIQSKHNGLSEETLAGDFGRKGLIANLNALQKRGLITLVSTWHAQNIQTPPIPDQEIRPAPTTTPILTKEQENCVQTLRQALETRHFTPFLLEGVTGSGKTEVYLQAIQRCLELGRQALLLVPEIALTSQMIHRLKARFPETLAVLHSGLTQMQRLEHWQRVRNGQARLAVGARSAVFAPFADLGLVIVDEEHDPSYKQEGGVPYQGRDMATVRAQRTEAVLILGSATPSMESLANVERGRFRHLLLTQRVGGGATPSMEAICLRDPAMRQAMGRDGLISPPLHAAITATLEAGRQVLLFLNRRGFAPSLLCYRCGQALNCPNCSVTLTLHKHAATAKARMLCHYCDFSQEPLDICPGCGQLSLFHFGPGTQRLEEESRAAFPQARIARLDRDSVSSGQRLQETLDGFLHRRLDILIGTQMTAKGHHFPGLSLVGVVQAETSLCQPDFRAAERTFQLVTQVAGRAGREDHLGQAIIQTFDPNHYALNAANNNPASFAPIEMTFRRQAGYPPFRRLALLRFSSTVKLEGDFYCQTLKASLPVSGDVEFLGPAPAPLSKLRNRYRWQVLIKEKEGGRLHRALGEVMRLAEELTTKHIQVEIDVDPYTFL
ncbi:MAG: primosomal protein N' [Magnetococcales bacterium]|nr:primosomal protein N' [Magnetococcales bacterium]